MQTPQSTGLHGYAEPGTGAHEPGRVATRLGRWTGVVTALTAAAAGLAVIGIPGAPPRSGPNCRGTANPCLRYPYTDAADYVPDDFIWMIPAFLLGPLLLVLLACLLDNVDKPRRLLARIALVLATISATVLMIDYYVQFTTVQASLVRGETDAGLSLLSQYNPHGVFIALEDIGYFAMLTALAVSATALGSNTRAERVLRRVLATAGTLGALALPVLLAVLGHDLEYWYELGGIIVAWTTLLVTGILTAIIFRSRRDVRALRPQEYSTRTEYRLPSRWYRRLNRLLGVPLASLGWAPRNAVTLEVHGRTTGRIRRTPVLVTPLGTERYLVALAGQSHWVRNVRAARGRAWLRRRGRTAVTLEEVPTRGRAPILLAYLQRPARDGTRRVDAGQARHYFGVGPNPKLADLAAVAGYYPVFRICAPGDQDPEPPL